MKSLTINDQTSEHSDSMNERIDIEDMTTLRLL